VRRSAGAIPNNFVIKPRGITLLAADQMQRFDVADSMGKPVAVRWSLTGSGCSGMSCGTIDRNGTYRAPHSLPHPIVVLLKGVPVSDPAGSVSTRIWLAPGAVADPAPDVAAAPTGADIPREREPEPVVTYEDGLLAIDADNTTLAEVLRLVGQKTGAVIALPAGGGLERIVEHAGPGEARQVLTQLLNGSHFNFVILSSQQYPYGPEQIVLSREGSNEILNAGSAPAPETATDAVPPDGSDSAETALAPPVVAASTTPKEKVPPEVIEQLMKDKAQQIRESAQQESAPQQSSPEENAQKQ